MAAMESLQKYNIGNENGARRAIIINNRDFDNSQENFEKRTYSDIDTALLLSLLKQMQFLIVNHKNKKAAEMKSIAEEYVNAINAAEDTEKIDCVLFFVLTYGEFGVLHGTDRPLQADELIAPFKGDRCPKLAAKPKLFVFQACNPEFYGLGRVVSDDVGDVCDDIGGVTAKKTYKIPAECNIHITWSLVPGFLRGSIVHGSIFVGAFNKVLSDEIKAQMSGRSATEWNSIMTRVLGMVDKELQLNAKERYINSEYLLPCTINMLTKSLYLSREVGV